MQEQSTEPSADILVVRVRQDNEACFIAGRIVNSNAINFRSVKDFNGVGVFHTIAKSDAYLNPCPDCPNEDVVLASLPTHETKFENYRLGVKIDRKAQ